MLFALFVYANVSGCKRLQELLSLNILVYVSIAIQKYCFLNTDNKFSTFYCANLKKTDCFHAPCEAILSFLSVLVLPLK